MDGITYIKELKKTEATKDIPVIMATAVMTDSEHLKIALDAGAVDYVRIPVDKVELTARIYSMLELSKSYRQIKELNATKDKFFSIIAHDLRNPFNSLISLSSGLLDGYVELDPERQKKYFTSINESARNGYKLLENLLQWSRSQTGRIKFHSEEFLVKELTDEALELLESSAFEKDIKISIEIPENLKINGDKDMLNTILRNIISNAVKFTNHGGFVNVSVKKVKFENSNINYQHAIEFKISDTGVGISQKNFDNLFRIDVNNSTPGTAKERGSGLGLLLCKEFVKRHGGDLFVESEEGNGSTFSFFIPEGKE